MKPLFTIAAVILSAGVLAQSNPDHEYTSNFLNVENTPKTSTQEGLYAFFDCGSWMGFALPEDNTQAFAGPYILGQDHGRWLSQGLVEFQIGGEEAELLTIEKSYLPGKLKLKSTHRNVEVNSELIFANENSAIITVEVVNNSFIEARLKPSFSGDAFADMVKFSRGEGSVLANLTSGQTLSVELIEHGSAIPYPAVIERFGYNIDFMEFSLFSGDAIKFALAITYHPDLKSPKLGDIDLATTQTEHDNRWDQYMSIANNPELTSTEKLILTKSISTLVSNWRSPAGELKHNGVFPSYHYKWFQGFWAWDSWKHAVALAKIDADLAKDQIRAMYNFQSPEGMIADCVFRDTSIESHNWRDTKPPLSSWAIWEVYNATEDLAFLEELYPKLVAYHNWWYEYRDFDGDGLCEYGSTDGTLTAAKWESGMDNAIRFDKAEIVKGSQYSINSESVDLNAYLALEKWLLAEMSAALGKFSESAEWEREFEQLKEEVLVNFYDEERGYFFDIDMYSGEYLNDALGPEGWTPLWCGLTDESIAADLAEIMMDTTKFNTTVPLPTIDISHPEFNPSNGYWRGPVWIDQMWFGIEGLKQAGYTEEAELLKTKAIENCEGLKEAGESIRENYHPITGEGLNAEHFSWSAAHFILLLTE